jgi:alpha-mannosidase
MPVPAEATPPTLRNSYLTVTLDEKTGAISSIKHKDLPVDLAGKDGELGLNDYLYIAGRNPEKPLRNGPVKITVKESGDMMASLLVETDAPGCNKLTREIRLISGLDRVDIIDTIDKKNIYSQEAVHLGFGFNVPGGVMRMDVPWGVVRPETDQLAGACKNYFTVQRWVDISNDEFGATLAVVDAPLIEVGAITNDPRGGVGWIKKLEPTTTLYSYVMNNYWETNYKAGQEGPTVFRYSIRPHKKFDSAEAARFGIERSQPLIVVPVDESTSVPEPIFSVTPEDVLVTAFKPSEDGEARIIRLYNAGERTRSAKITWAKPAPKTVWRSNLAEEKVSQLTGPIRLAPYEFATLRIPMGK